MARDAMGQRMTTLYAALFSRQDIIDNREPS
jgi:hypothetical protein